MNPTLIPWRRALAVAGLALAILACALAPAPAKAASPFARAGMWIWYVDSSHGGDPGRIIARAKRSGIGTLYVKSGDGSSAWSQFTPGLIDRFQRAGLDVCGWQYVYGENPVAEAKISALAKSRGADCFVIDAEAEYEGEYAAADKYVRALRKRVGPSFPLALSTFPYVDYHPAFPYSVFLGPGAATDNLPQMYWTAIGTSVRTVFEHTYLNNRLYKRPIYPVGQTYMNPPKGQLLQFRRFTLTYGGAPSWWSWQETNNSEWQTLGRKTAGKIRGYRPLNSHPALGKGAKGDQVVWAQQHLNGAGIEVPMTGVFGKLTRAAVRKFQGMKGLEVDGVLGSDTWRALLKYEPAKVVWSARASRSMRGLAGASAAGPPAPLSASLPPRRDELGSVPR